MGVKEGGRCLLEGGIFLRTCSTLYTWKTSLAFIVE